MELVELVENIATIVKFVDKTGEVASSAIGIVSALIALVFLANCFFGYKLFKLQIAIAGFFVGAYFGAGVATLIEFLSDFSGNMTIVYIILTLVFAVLGAKLAFRFYRLGLFLAVAVVTILISGIVSAIAGSDVILFVGLALAVVLGVLAVVLSRPYLIAITAIPSGLSAGPFVLLAFGSSSIGGGILVGALLAAAGAVVQWKTTGNEVSAPQPAGAGNEDAAVAAQAVSAPQPAVPGSENAAAAQTVSAPQAAGAGKRSAVGGGKPFELKGKYIAYALCALLALKAWQELSSAGSSGAGVLVCGLLSIAALVVFVLYYKNFRVISREIDRKSFRYAFYAIMGIQIALRWRDSITVFTILALAIFIAYNRQEKKEAGKEAQAKKVSALAGDQQQNQGENASADTALPRQKPAISFKIPEDAAQKTKEAVQKAKEELRNLPEKYRQLDKNYLTGTIGAVVAGIIFSRLLVAIIGVYGLMAYPKVCINVAVPIACYFAYRLTKGKMDIVSILLPGLITVIWTVKTVFVYFKNFRYLSFYGITRITLRDGIINSLILIFFGCLGVFAVYMINNKLSPKSEEQAGNMVQSAAQEEVAAGSNSENTAPENTDQFEDNTAN